MFPFHITSAMSAYLAFIACVVFCVLVCLGKKVCPHLAKICAEVGILFALETITTGMIWAHEAWGTAWVWEPRLTGMFLTTLFFISWRLAIAILGDEAVSNRKMTASLIVLGLPAIAFTHVAAQFFGGIHPRDVSHLAEDALRVAPFVWAGCLQLAVGAGVIFMRLHQHKKCGRIEEALPTK